MNDKQTLFLHDPSIGLCNNKIPNQTDLEQAAELTINKFQSEYHNKEHHTYSLKNNSKSYTTFFTNGLGNYGDDNGNTLRNP